MGVHEGWLEMLRGWYRLRHCSAVLTCTLPQVSQDCLPGVIPGSFMCTIAQVAWVWREILEAAGFGTITRGMSVFKDGHHSRDDAHND